MTDSILAELEKAKQKRDDFLDKERQAKESHAKLIDNRNRMLHDFVQLFEPEFVNQINQLDGFHAIRSTIVMADQFSGFKWLVQCDGFKNESVRLVPYGPGIRIELEDRSHSRFAIDCSVDDNKWSFCKIPYDRGIFGTYPQTIGRLSSEPSYPVNDLSEAVEIILADVIFSMGSKFDVKKDICCGF